MLIYQVNAILKRPQMCFGRDEYTLKEVIAYLDGYVVAQNYYTDVDERDYTMRVKMYLKERYKSDIDISKHIVYIFDDLFTDEQKKIQLLLSVLKELYKSNL